MVAARLPGAGVHSLLHHRPCAVVGDHEAVQVEIEPVLDRGAVDLRHQPTGAGETGRIEPDRSPRAPSSSGVLRECLPRPPQT